MAQLNDFLEVDGLVEERQELNRLLLTESGMAKKIQSLIRKVLTEVQRNLSEQAREGMKADPRNAHKAVRTLVYRRILGGNVNILSKRKAGQPSDYAPARRLRSGQRGGNRRKRSERTKRLQGYQGTDRGFILRFLNAGTQGRFINFIPNADRERVNRGSRGGNVKKYGKTINTGRRGNIKARNWFGEKSRREMEKAAEILGKYIDDTISRVLKN